MAKKPGIKELASVNWHVPSRDIYILDRYYDSAFEEAVKKCQFVDRTTVTLDAEYSVLELHIAWKNRIIGTWDGRRMETFL